MASLAAAGSSSSEEKFEKFSFATFPPEIAPFEDSLLTETKGGTVAGIRHAIPRSFSHP